MLEDILNKVDMEIRERINQSTEEHRVHPKGEVQSVKKYNGNKQHKKNNRNNENEDDKEFVIPKNRSKNNKIVITAVKSNKVVVDAELNKDNSSSGALEKGNYLDIRR
ncbi:hypothetical protein [Clostridium guangxiense]|uniref:hypothetical protein n=1 Tax=Clostridium guangxiense TaxID=1662055 RepID=UPI001E2F0B6A|nr:hypothetical protein [Clostridium guangxiense]MCD2345263.1 hypothetical protein [Clostridium guangxiense]